MNNMGQVNVGDIILVKNLSRHSFVVISVEAGF
jgi:hypothetical protein